MAIDGAIAQFQENSGAVNHARAFRRYFDREGVAFDVRTSGGLGTSGLNNGAVSRWLPPVAGVPKGDMAVSQRGAGANMSVDVAPGGAVVGGTASATQGSYFAYNDATVNVSIAAADATNPRIDVVGLQVRDTEYGESTTDLRIVVVTGTAAASPAVPALPAEFLTLAHVSVVALASSIDNAHITDKRVSSGTGVVTCTSATRPTVGLFPGQLIYETDTNKLQQYTTSTTGWVPPWNLPWGTIEAVNFSTNYNNTPTNVAVSGAHTTVANRKTFLGGDIAAFTSTDAGGSTVTLKIDSTSLVAYAPVAQGIPNADRWFISTGWIHVPSAASHTWSYVIQNGIASTRTATGTLNIQDIGPNAGPS